MQKPEVILDMLKQRSLLKLEINKIYRYLYNPEWYIKAYYKLSNNDDINDIVLKRINDIIEDLRYEKYIWSNQVLKSTQFKSLSLPEWRDRLLEEVLLMILSAIYEPRFLECSHAFRPNKGIHTTLQRISNKGQACEWFIVGKIKDYYKTLNHNVLLTIISNTISDGRFIALLRKLLLRKPNLFNELNYDQTYSGTPYDGILFPLLTNIYLNELDYYIEDKFMNQYNRLKDRERNKQYKLVSSAIERKQKKYNVNPSLQLRADLKTLRKKLRLIPTKAKIYECNYRRFTYTRYADSFIITFTGLYKEACDIMKSITNYLANNLSLEILHTIYKANDEKQPARFLQYSIITQYSNSKISKGKRTLAGNIAFMIPNDIIQSYISKYSRNNKPIHKSEYINLNVYDIILLYQAEFKGICQYYQYARNQKLLHKLNWIIRGSLLKTLAAKFKTTTAKIRKKYDDVITIDDHTYHVISETINSISGKIYKVYYGAIPLYRQIYYTNVINDILPTSYSNHSTISQRLQNDVCEICGSTVNIQTHHIHAIKDIDHNKVEWIKKMIIMKRKTIAVCSKCHRLIHNGKYDGRKLS